MAEYTAKMNVQIDRRKFKKGEKVTGVPEDRCEPLVGKFLHKSDATKPQPQGKK